MDRIDRIASLIREMGLDTVRRFEERDPQYVAISRLCGSIGDKCKALALTTLNSLVSYMLTGRGERHWNYFSDYFSKRGVGNICDDFIKYVLASPFLGRLRQAKVRRIREVCSSGIVDELAKCGLGLDEMAKRLGEALGVDWRAKTMVFSVKMAYYVFRACGDDPPRLPNVPIPVDYRVSTITHCSGLSSEPPRKLMGKQRLVQDIWDQVSKLSGVPAINLDSLIWVMGGALIYNDFDVGKAMDEVKPMVPGKEEAARLLLMELSRDCRGGVNG